MVFFLSSWSFLFFFFEGFLGGAAPGGESEVSILGVVIFGAF
jgi:hypothetical protein